MPSGLAAITLVDLSLLGAGDEVLIPDNAYGPGKELARAELSRWGISHRFYDAMNPQSLADALGPATRLVWLEAAGSVTMEFPDLAALVRIARTHGATTVLDNTWGAGVAFDPFQLEPGLGVDVSVQALTKYPSGGADVLMGSVTTRDAALHLRIRATHMRMGWCVGANDVEMVLRSLPDAGAALPRAGIGRRGGWRTGGRPVPRSAGCCTRRSKALRATTRGRGCVGLPPACSRWCSTSATVPTMSTASSTA